MLGPFLWPAAAIVGAVALLAAGLLIRYAFYTSPDQAAVKQAPRISDQAFEQAASAVCKQYTQVFDTATTLPQSPSKDQAGAFLETIATTFDQMVTKLSALQVNTPDRSSVDEWLAEWRTYDAYGHQYATAVRNAAERDLVRNDKGRIDGLLRRRNGFAKANHISACAFS